MDVPEDDAVSVSEAVGDEVAVMEEVLVLDGVIVDVGDTVAGTVGEFDGLAKTDRDTVGETEMAAVYDDVGVPEPVGDLVAVCVAELDRDGDAPTESDDVGVGVPDEVTEAVFDSVSVVEGVLDGVTRAVRERDVDPVRVRVDVAVKVPVDVVEGGWDGGRVTDGVSEFDGVIDGLAPTERDAVDDGVCDDESVAVDVAV